MAKYTATLTRTIETSCTFESTDIQTGTKIGQYSVPMTLSQGTRTFKTMKQAKAWVELMNRDHGIGAATYNGKQ